MSVARQPHQALVHHVDTEEDIPPGMEGVAVGHTALPDEHHHAAGEADLYQTEPIVPVDRKLRATFWRAMAALYLAACAGVALYLWG